MTITLELAIQNKCRDALSRVTEKFETPENFGDLSPIQRMFALAIDGMTQTPLAGLDEEAITASFAARMATQFTWAVECSRLPPEKPAQWGQYSKNGQNEDSESQRGADFALVIPVNSKVVRIAIFQAKKARADTVKIKQAGSKSAPEDQMDKLLATAAAINGLVGIYDHDYSWIHYAFWRGQKEFPKSLALASIDDPKSEHHVNIKAHPDCGSFADLLLRGPTERDDEKADGTATIFNGWLQLPMEDAKASLPMLLAVTDVVFVDETGGGAELVEVLSSNCHDEAFEVKISSVSPDSLNQYVHSPQSPSSHSFP